MYWQFFEFFFDAMTRLLCLVAQLSNDKPPVTYIIDNSTAQDKPHRRFIRFYNVDYKEASTVARRCAARRANKFSHTRRSYPNDKTKKVI